MTERKRAIRQVLEVGILCLSGLLLARAVGCGSYVVPTGSMAPTLLGHHKAIPCLSCQFPIRVGVVATDQDAGDVPGWPACPNCGHVGPDFREAPVIRGDGLLVNRTAYDFFSPRRWESAVFRHPSPPGRVFVKRIVGLPGELLQLRGGDLYIDHEICRKSLAEALEVAIPVFTMDHVSQDGWSQRWERVPQSAGVDVLGSQHYWPADPEGKDIRWLVYRHLLHQADQARPISDESAYNGESGRGREPVHDFLVSCEVEVQGEEGAFFLQLSDGASDMIVEIPLLPSSEGIRLFEETPQGRTQFRTVPLAGLVPGRRTHLVFALVDRRVHLTLDGRPCFPPLDRPALDNRPDVVRPLRLGVCRLQTTVTHLLLSRDVHYTAPGPHLGHTPVRLKAHEYLVLGDNSANSDDNRFWTDAAGQPVPVPLKNFLGRPFLLHLPSRMGPNGRLELDRGRIRRLR